MVAADALAMEETAERGACREQAQPDDPLNPRLVETNASTEASQKDSQKEETMVFGVEDRPPLIITGFYALQVVLSIIGSPITASYVIHTSICGGENSVLLAQLISTSLFMVGITTFMQVTFGIRLPMTQCSAFMFLPAIKATMETPRWQCPPTPGSVDVINGTTVAGAIEEPWLPRLAEISGSLAVASLIQVFIGISGLIGHMTRYIGPLTVTPTLALVSISLYDVVNKGAHHQWGITALTSGLTITFAFVLGAVECPFPSWNREKGWHFIRFPVFRIFANNFSLLIAWLLCFILTVTDVFPSDPDAHGYLARTDTKLDAIAGSRWFYLPYPGQYGAPTVSFAGVLAFIPSILGSIIESIGDYYATAHVVGAPRPPKHAINRAITVEGVGSILAGLFGACHATTSYSEVIGFIGYTKMASRFTWQIASVFFILGGLCGKFGAVLALIPAPMVSGMALVGLSMVLSIAISNLELLNMRSSRNQMILGLAIVLGVCVPRYIEQHPESVETGYVELSQIVSVVVRNGSLVAGLAGFLLDNILPGSRQDRGLWITEGATSGNHVESIEQIRALKIYDIPISKHFHGKQIFRYIPFLPTYDDTALPLSCRKRAVKT